MSKTVLIKNTLGKNVFLACSLPKIHLVFSKYVLLASSIVSLGMMAAIHPSFAQDLYDYQTGTTSGNARSNTNGSQYYDSQVWSTIIGASVFLKPAYEGDNSYRLQLSPVLSIGQYGFGPRFISHNDNMSFSLVESSMFRFGLNGKILGERDHDQSDDLVGLRKVKWGGEIGAFAELYPVNNIRLRAELRHGLRTHNAYTSNLSMDVFQNISPTMQISAGPRAFYATKDYYNTYYGVDAAESAETHLAEFSGHSGFGSVGFGGEIAWKTTDTITTSVFAEYSRLTGSAADSSLVHERGSKNQLSIGVSANYRFDQKN